MIYDLYINSFYISRSLSLSPSQILIMENNNKRKCQLYEQVFKPSGNSAKRIHLDSHGKICFNIHIYLYIKYIFIYI